MNTTRTIDTTLGSLIASLTEEVSRYVPEEKKAYRVAAMLADLHKNNRVSPAIGRRRNRAGADRRRKGTHPWIANL